MASFSYKYFSIDDRNNSLFLTWESGYTNLKVYHNGQLIKEIATAQELLRGVHFDHDDISGISIQLAKEKPMILKVSVNNREYIPENKLAERGEINGLISVFWWLFGLGMVGTFYEIYNVIEYLDNIQLTYVVIIDSVILIAYGFTAVMLRREYAWSYFIGTTVFLLTTLLIIYNTYLFSSSFAIILVYIIRGIFTFFIVKHYPIIMRMMKNSHKVENYDLLDDF